VYSLVPSEQAEADDIIAWLLETFFKNTQSVILSSDKDFYQLVTDTVSVYRPISPAIVLGLDNFKEYTEYESPEHYKLGRCLQGDSTDKVKGVPKIGEKTAWKIVQACGTNCDEIKQVIGVGEAASIFDRNKALLDLSIADQHIPEVVQTEIQEVLSAPLAFEEDYLREQFKKYGFAKILSGYLQWLFPFRRLMLRDLMSIIENTPSTT
jgi:5'-3' exonuclease